MNSATTRVLSALVLIPLLVALIWWAPERLFQSVIAVAAIVALIELSRLVTGWPVRIVLMVIYIVAPLNVLALIRAGYGPTTLTMLIAIVIVSDSAQYYTGRAFGSRKLAPVISPKKTVEGAIGGLIFAAVAAVIFGRIWPIGLGDVGMGLTGLAIAVAGMAGDLFESALKRRARVKDSGHLIPGHGGILDRIDSWLFAAPVFWLILKVTL
ncbi:MAG: phosphatidate cytidylyltransferase [Acidobacteria bacterium]|nr:MAG: phosphatidate cytidylyltransferase [Acidobacteriota bacterium]